MIAPSLANGIDDVIAANRTTWLRDAEATIMALDPRGFRGGRLHVFDFTDIDAPAEGFLGLAAGGQLHELARHLLPADDTIVAAVAVNAARIATLSGTDEPEEIAAAITVVAAHEIAHVVDAQATGTTLPAGATLEGVVRSLTDGRATAPAHQTKGHSAGWLRAYLHLLVRASGLPHYRTWLAGFIRDVEAVLPHEPGTYLAAIEPDILAHRRDARLVDVLRSPAPAGFVSLFPN